MFDLPRVKQCDKCPWRKDVDPHDIPDGYSEELHLQLGNTIAEPGSLLGLAKREIRAMACHESPVGREYPCLGWLINQLGPGNNLALRMKMRHCRNLHRVELVGDQHECFEDTLPE